MYWLSNISTVFSIISLLVGIFYFKTIKKYLIPIFVIVSISAIVEIVTLIFKDFSINNLSIFHIYTFFEFSLIYIFYLLFYKSYIKINILYLILPVFYLIGYFDYKVNGISEMDNFSITIESSVFIVISLISFLFLMNRDSIEKIKAPFFWINSGVLIYFSGNILLFTFCNYLNKSELEMYKVLWLVIHSLLNIAYNILICIGFYKSRKV